MCASTSCIDASIIRHFCVSSSTLGVGDKVVCLISKRTIVSAYSEFEMKVILEVIALYADGLLLYIPKHIRLDDCIDITKTNIEKFGIAKKFIGSRCFYITEHKVAKIYAKLDGMCCQRCKEFFPMAVPNQEDGKTMLCFLCRKYKYR